MNINLLRNYFRFSSTESKGITLLLVMVIIILSISLCSMKYFIHPPSLLKTDSSLTAAWNTFKLRNKPASTDIPVGISETMLFPFDPNTLDSLGFISLGLKPVTTKMVINWRKKGKVFYHKEEFKKLYTLSEEEYNRLAPYISIQGDTKQPLNNHSSHYKNNYLTQLDHVDINTTDSLTLVRIRGIGPFFAHKIIERRNALGGYLKHEQLMEAYKFRDSTFMMLKEKLIINTQAVRRININIASEDRLKSHPYIGEKIAKNILIYRDAVKHFEKIEQLRQVPLMNEEIYRKIAPYLSTE